MRIIISQLEGITYDHYADIVKTRPEFPLKEHIICSLGVYHCSRAGKG
jgi:hypothetical protein